MRRVQLNEAIRTKSSVVQETSSSTEGADDAVTGCEGRYGVEDGVDECQVTPFEERGEGDHGTRRWGRPCPRVEQSAVYDGASREQSGIP